MRREQQRLPDLRRAGQVQAHVVVRVAVARLPVLQNQLARHGAVVGEEAAEVLAQLHEVPDEDKAQDTAENGERSEVHVED